MSWATHHIELLQQGIQVRFRPLGNSMAPRIKSGQLCTVEPVPLDTIKAGDVVLCSVGRSDYLHLVKEVFRTKDGSPYFAIGNNRGNINGTTTGVYGKLIAVE